jgi:hypothetical protein
MSNQFRFGINHLICWVLMGMTAVSLVHIAPAHAFMSSGYIDGNYSFEDLELRRGIVNSTRHGRVHSCVLRGEIVSTSGKERQNVTITFYAINIFDEQIWESAIRIKSLPPYESHKFSKKISCQDKEPYKWQFKVSKSPEKFDQ